MCESLTKYMIFEGCRGIAAHSDGVVSPSEKLRPLRDLQSGH